MRIPRTHRCQTSGQSAVDLALSLVALIFISAFVFELMSYSYTYCVLTEAAKQGVRYAIVHGSNNSVICAYPCTGTPATAAEAVAKVVQTTAAQSFHDVSSLTVNVTYPDGDHKAPSRVQVVVTYNYVPYASLGWQPGTMYATAAGRILN